MNNILSRLNSLIESKNKSDIFRMYQEMSDYYQTCISNGFEQDRLVERAALKKSTLKVLDVIENLHRESDIQKVIEANKNILTEEEYRILKDANKRRKLGDDTKGANQKGGFYSKSRLSLHKKIISEFLAGVPSQRNPTVLFLAGVGGSGKSTTLKAMGINKHKYVIIDADKIKEKLPEFTKESSLQRAAVTHDESSDIAQKLTEAAVNKKVNLIIDGTMKNIQKAKIMLNKAKRKGYTTEMIGTQLPTHKAMERNIKRYIDEKDDMKKRFVPLEVIKTMGKDVNKAILTLKPEFDKYTLYNTDVPEGEKPKVIEKSRKR